MSDEDELSSSVYCGLSAKLFVLLHLHKLAQFKVLYKGLTLTGWDTIAARHDRFINWFNLGNSSVTAYQKCM